MVNPVAALRLARRPGTAVILVSYGLGYATYSCLQASLSTLFLDVYNISGLASGLIYMPFGVACALSALGTGKLLDRNYQCTAAEVGITAVGKTNSSDIVDFPIERARLRMITWLIAASACLIATYGWQLQTSGVSMAGPLVTQFFIGLTVQSMFTALNTLLVDLHQDEPSTAQAGCNLFRCEMAAGLLAAVDMLLRMLGPGWTFVIFAWLILAAFGMLAVLRRKGMQWRQDGLAKQQNRQTEGGGVTSAGPSKPG